MAKKTATPDAAPTPPVGQGALSVPVDPQAQVIKWMIGGQSESDIREALQATWPTADADALLVRATDHFEQASQCEPSVVIGWALEAYRDLYRRQLGIGDFDGARKVLKELVALATKHGVHDTDESGEEGDEKTPAD